MIRPIPDWMLNDTVVLAMPGGENPDPHRVDIVMRYSAFLRGQGIPVKVLVSSYLPHGVFEALEKMGAKIDNIVANDIWIRDWGPLPCEKGNSRVAVKFYFNNQYSYNTGLDNRAGYELAMSLGWEMIHSKLTWDMGNFTTNGRDIIATDQVLIENGLKDETDLKDSLLADGFASDIRVFILPCHKLDRELWTLYNKPPSEAISHIDGNMRFLDDHKIVCALPNTDMLSQHLQSHPAGADTPIRQKQLQYLNICVAKRELIEILGNKLKGNGHQLVPIETDMGIPTFTKEESGEEALSDLGDYINFLRFGNLLFLPQYYPLMNEQEDQAACAVYRNAGIDVVPVDKDFVLRLARLGGVLNCASWVS